jgi:hypothetical protein
LIFLFFFAKSDQLSIDGIELSAVFLQLSKVDHAQIPERAEAPPSAWMLWKTCRALRFFESFPITDFDKCMNCPPKPHWPIRSQFGFVG